jgi:hypothetical protein
VLGVCAVQVLTSSSVRAIEIRRIPLRTAQVIFVRAASTARVRRLRTKRDPLHSLVRRRARYLALLSQPVWSYRSSHNPLQCQFRLNHKYDVRSLENRLTLSEIYTLRGVAASHRRERPEIRADGALWIRAVADGCFAELAHDAGGQLCE